MNIKKRTAASALPLVGMLIFFLIACSGCSIKKLAAGSFADALSSGAGASFTAEGDLELVEGALPFSLKAMESLLEKAPAHRGLHLSLAQGYMLYAYAFADLKAEEIKDADFAEYQRLRSRARALYGRAHEYAKKGLILSSKKFGGAFQANNQEALQLIKKKQDAAFLYWAGISLTKLITLSKTDPAAAIRLPEAAAYMQRAFEIDPDYDSGAIYEFFIAYEARGAIMGGDAKKAEEHFKKAVALARGEKLSPLLTYAEALSIPGQNRQEFDAFMKQIMDFDIEQHPEYRLLNALTKKRAQQLLKKKDDLFLGE